MAYRLTAAAFAALTTLSLLAAGHASAQSVAAESIATVSVKAAAKSSTSPFGERKAELKERTAEIKNDIKEKQVEVKAEFEKSKTKLDEKRTEAVKRLSEGRKKLVERAEELRAKLLGRGSEARKNLTAEAKARVITSIDSVARRFGTIAEHLENVSGRIETRIDDLEKKGYNLDKSAELLADADAKLSAAKEDIVAAEKLAKEELAKETSKEELKALIGAAKESLKLAHSGYVEVVHSIRAEVKAQVDVKSATSTES